MHMHHHHEHEEQPGSREQAKLAYLYEHNCHHNDELQEMAEGLSGEAKEHLLRAVKLYGEANEQLHLALHAMEE